MLDGPYWVRLQSPAPAPAPAARMQRRLYLLVAASLGAMAADCRSMRRCAELPVHRAVDTWRCLRAGRDAVYRADYDHGAPTDTRTVRALLLGQYQHHDDHGQRMQSGVQVARVCTGHVGLVGRSLRGQLSLPCSGPHRHGRLSGRMDPVCRDKHDVDDVHHYNQRSLHRMVHVGMS